MKLILSAVVSVFVKDGEDIQAVRKALLSLFPFGLEAEKVPVIERSAKGFQDKDIRILEVKLGRERLLSRFLGHLLSLLNGEQKQLILSQMESRLDEELYFFIRLDKEKLLNNEVFITDGGSCFHIRMSIAAFPASREAALAVIGKIFK